MERASASVCAELSGSQSKFSLLDILIAALDCGLLRSRGRSGEVSKAFNYARDGTEQAGTTRNDADASLNAAKNSLLLQLPLLHALLQLPIGLALNPLREMVNL